MVVMTAKVSKAKLIAFFCVLAAVICIVAYALFGESDAPEAPANAADNDARIAFLASYGWEVDPTPTEMQDVRIPEDMNEVFAAYNELQRTQGFDLTRFSGQTAQRYVYQITNYSDMSAPVYASLLIVDGAVIGGDITSTAGSGTMHGFEAPAGSRSAPTAVNTPDEVTEETPQEEAASVPDSTAAEAALPPAV
ncbi:MAG: DUF4830 domain-containing protein [Oscillospiraceae bacterium]|nr:DUF4830 domain-containing protein [Oscillospiraceae bacterium]